MKTMYHINQGIARHIVVGIIITIFAYIFVQIGAKKLSPEIQECEAEILSWAAKNPSIFSMSKLDKQIIKVSLEEITKIDNLRIEGVSRLGFTGNKRSFILYYSKNSIFKVDSVGISVSSGFWKVADSIIYRDEARIN